MPWGFYRSDRGLRNKDSKKTIFYRSDRGLAWPSDLLILRLVLMAFGSRNAVRSQGATGRSQEEPGGAKMSQEEPGEARRSHEEPGGAMSQEEPGRAAGLTRN